MPRPKKTGGFSVDLKKPAVTSESWSPNASRKETDEEDRKKMDGKYHLSTLLEAEEIRQDPEKMKYAMEHADQKMSRIRSLQDLKDVAEAKFGAGAKKRK